MKNIDQLCRNTWAQIASVVTSTKIGSTVSSYSPCKKYTSRNILTTFEEVLKNMVGLQWRWYVGTQPFFGSPTVYLYCNGKYPSWTDNWTPTCQTNTYGWSHGGYWLPTSVKWTYAIGFCTEHFDGTFQPLSNMLQMARVGTADKSNEEVLGGNYGRAAIHQLIELWDLVSPERGTSDTLIL